VRRGTTSRSRPKAAPSRFQLHETSPHLDCLLAKPVRRITIGAVYLVPVADPTQPREHRLRSRATDTAELDAAAALVQLTSLVQSIHSRIAVRHDLTPVRAAVHRGGQPSRDG
jgi:hypothetical protein